jgi:hypothetical protein
VKSIWIAWNLYIVLYPFICFHERLDTFNKNRPTTVLLEFMFIFHEIYIGQFLQLKYKEHVIKL